jgi:multicomponent Na+:H+ antiporter subunit A
MVKAGVYLVARFSPIFATYGPWRLLVLGIGCLTMIIGGWRALRQHDLKLLLAYGTVSQLGFMMLLFGTGEYKIAQAGIVLLLAHAAFKAALFMIVGIIDHQYGTRDIRMLTGLGAGWMSIKVMVVLSAASMAGVPPLLGFIAKEKGIDGYLEDAPFSGATAVLVVIVVGSMLTFAYSARFVLGVFGGYAEAGATDTAIVHPVAGHPDSGHAKGVPPSLVFAAPAALLTAFTVVAGVAPVIIDQLVEAATIALEPAASPSPVQLWNGFNTALALSALIIGCGVALTFARARVARFQTRLAHVIRRLPSTDDIFIEALRATNLIANRVTGVVQSGSLPIYLLVILATATVVPVIPLITEFDTLPGWVEDPIQIPLVIVVLSCAIGATVIKRRISAAVMLGTAGMAMAGIYEARGAPDLALTQFSIEILSTVLFVLVLRFLPRRFIDSAPAIVRPVRLGVAVLVGAAVFVFAMVSTASRSEVVEPSVSVEIVDEVEAKDDGRNIIDVILVDVRGIDTLGEITVLAVAALGVVSLATSRRRRRFDEGDVLEPTAPRSEPERSTPQGVGP